MENHIGNARYRKKDPLIAEDAEAAVKEGREKWEERLSKGTYKGWDQETYPNDPIVVYEIPIGDQNSEAPQNLPQ